MLHIIVLVKRPNWHPSFAQELGTANRGREGQYDNCRRPEIISSTQYTRLLREALKLAENPVVGGACHEPAIKPGDRIQTMAKRVKAA